MTLVRPATVADTIAVRATHVAAIEAFGPDAYDDRAVAAWAERDENQPLEGLRDPDTCWVVAERGGPSDAGGADPSVAGFGRLDAADGEVVAVYVHPDHARKGVGSAVLANLEGYARGAGRSELTLTASLNAVGFYERLGYERVRSVVHRTSGGVELDCVEMRKSL